MTRSTLTHWAFLTATALSAVALLDCLAPNQVQASCGDYVTIVPAHGQPTHQPMHPAGERDMSPPEGPVRAPCGQCPHEPMQPGRPPCEGPSCSGNPLPATVPTTTTDRSLDSWACWWSNFLCSLTQSTPHRPAADQLCRSQHADPIFHPPRA